MSATEKFPGSSSGGMRQHCQAENFLEEISQFERALEISSIKKTLTQQDMIYEQALTNRRDFLLWEKSALQLLPLGFTRVFKRKFDIGERIKISRFLSSSSFNLFKAETKRTREKEFSRQL